MRQAERAVLCMLMMTGVLLLSGCRAEERMPETVPETRIMPTEESTGVIDGITDGMREGTEDLMDRVTDPEEKTDLPDGEAGNGREK